MAKHVIFGAGGFIGQHLVKALASVDGDEIIAFDRFSRYKTGAEHPFVGLTNVQVVAGDFFNREEVSAALDGADYVFHFISSTNPAKSDKDPFIDIDTNVRNSVELLNLCVEHHVKKVIFPSSGGSVYGDVQSEIISEETVPQPRSPYGIGKLTIEHYLRYFKFTSGLDYVVYRIANPYGPGQNIYGKQGVVPIFMHKFLNHEPISVYDDGTMIRDYFYISDLIGMITSTYAQAGKYNEYNLGSGTGESVNALITAIESVAGYSVEKLRIDTPPTFVQKSVLDTSRFTSEFGARTFTSLADGMARTWEYVKQLG